MNFKIDEFKINILKDKDLPYSDKDPISLEELVDLDDEGVVVFVHDGKNYYHPVLILETAISLLNHYKRVNRDEHLEKAQKYIERLMMESKDINGAIFFPYPFDFELHELKDKTNLLKAPWYSGMAQGEALTVLSRLFEITKEERYKKYADQVFKSFLTFREADKIWISEIDEKGYFWIDEYPSESNCKALNGFMFAIFGLYDYWRVFESKESLGLLNASLTTIKNYLDKYRNINSLSYYCLGHKKKSATYHKVHIGQLKMLYKITDDKFFQEMAKKFERDGKHPFRLLERARNYIINKLNKS